MQRHPAILDKYCQIMKDLVPKKKKKYQKIASKEHTVDREDTITEKL